MKSNNKIPDDKKIDWAIKEYQLRIKECKSVKFSGDSDKIKLQWESRRKIAGINKKECDIILERAASILSEKKGVSR